MCNITHMIMVIKYYFSFVLTAFFRNCSGRQSENEILMSGILIFIILIKNADNATISGYITRIKYGAFFKDFNNLSDALFNITDIQCFSKWSQNFKYGA